MPKRLTSDQGGHYGNRPIKADEGTNGDSRLREYGSHLLANVLRRPRICMRESFFANFPTQDHQILFELGILVCYTNIIIRFNFLNPNSDRKWPNLAFLLLPIYSRFGKAPPHWRSTNLRFVYVEYLHRLGTPFTNSIELHEFHLTTTATITSRHQLIISNWQQDWNRIYGG